MRVIRNSAIYTAVRIIKNGIGLFLLPVYTVYLTTSDYGVVSVVTSLVSFVTIFLLLSMNGAGVRFHYDYGEAPSEQRAFWGSIYAFVLLNAAVITGVLIAGHRFLVDPFFGEVPFYPYLLLGLLSGLFQVAFAVFQSYLRADQQGERFGANDMAFFVVKVGLTLTFVVIFEMAALGVILALALTNLAFMVVSHIRFTRIVRLRIHKAHVKQALGYGLPMLPHALAGFAMTLIDRVFIINMKSASDVGIYTIGFQIAGVLQMLAIAANQAYSPWFYQKCKEGDAGIRKVQELSSFFVSAFAVTGLGLVLFSREVLELFVTTDFEGGWVVTPFLVFAFVFRGFYFMVVGPIFLERVRWLPIITLSSALLNVLLNYCLIGPFGIMGASAASLITMFVAAVATLAVSSSLKPMGYRWKRMLAVSLGCGVLSLVVYLDTVMGWWQLLALKLGVAAVASLAFLYTYRSKGMQFLRSLKR